MLHASTSCFSNDSDYCRTYVNLLNGSRICHRCLEPSAKMSIRKTETVLKGFTKRIHGLANQSYDVRLKALNEQVSKVAVLELTLLCYKMLYGL